MLAGEVPRACAIQASCLPSEAHRRMLSSWPLREILRLIATPLSFPSAHRPASPILRRAGPVCPPQCPRAPEEGAVHVGRLGLRRGPDYAAGRHEPCDAWRDQRWREPATKRFGRPARGLWGCETAVFADNGAMARLAVTYSEYPAGGRLGVYGGEIAGARSHGGLAGPHRRRRARCRASGWTPSPTVVGRSGPTA